MAKKPTKLVQERRARVEAIGDRRIDEVLAACGALARFKRPSRVVVVDELPRNAMGKVQKKKLAD